jgi:acyl carrier protein
MKLTKLSIIELLEKSFHHKKGTVKLSTPLESIVKDSMDIMEFIAILNKDYGIEIDPMKIMECKNVQDLADYLLLL